MLAASERGLSCANKLRKKPAMMCMPLSWKRPLRLASRSMLIKPVFPRAAVAVMRTGLPNEYPPISRTLSPFTWPTLEPSTSTSKVPSWIISRMRVSIRLWRSIFEDKAPRIFRDDAIAHGHLFVKFDAHLEDFAEVLFILIKQFVKRAIPDEDHFHIDVDGLRLLRAAAEGIKHFERLNLQPVVVQSALQRAPHTDFREGFQRIHDQEAAIGAEQRTGAQIHEVAGPAASRVVGTLDSPEEVGVGGSGFENDRRFVIVVVRKN